MSSSLKSNLGRRAVMRHLSLAPLVVGLAGCAALLPHRDPLKVDVVGLDALPGAGLELRFLVKLRVQNPNDFDVPYDGLSFDMELRDAPFASGVSQAAGTVPRFGEATIPVPVSISGLAVVRQVMALTRSEDGRSGGLPYVLRGKLGGGLLGTVRFEKRGEVRLGRAEGEPAR